MPQAHGDKQHWWVDDISKRSKSLNNSSIEQQSMHQRLDCFYSFEGLEKILQQLGIHSF